MNINRKIANKSNYGEHRSTSQIKYLVYHYTANDGDTDEANANYFQNNIVEASAHYFVDDNSITQSVPDDYVAWSVGGSKYANTNGGKFHEICTNYNSISVELCDNVRNGVYDFTPNTLNNAVELGRMLMKKYNIPIDHVIRHYDVTGKICPKPFVENERAWLEFKNRLKEVGWIKDNIGWWYKNADGSYPKKRWLKLDAWYYFNENGYAVTGWRKIEGRWYFFDQNCHMKTGWLNDKESWFFLNKSGQMLENEWYKEGNKWYFLKKGGYMAKNEMLWIGNEIFCFMVDGHMARTNDRGALQ